MQPVERRAAKCEAGRVGRFHSGCPAIASRIGRAACRPASPHPMPHPNGEGRSQPCRWLCVQWGAEVMDWHPTSAEPWRRHRVMAGAVPPPHPAGAAGGSPPPRAARARETQRPPCSTRTGQDARDHPIRARVAAMHPADAHQSHQPDVRRNSGRALRGARSCGDEENCIGWRCLPRLLPPDQLDPETRSVGHEPRHLGVGVLCWMTPAIPRSVRHAQWRHPDARCLRTPAVR